MAQALILLLLITTTTASTHVHNAVETEMFAIPISPNLFNWTYQGLHHFHCQEYIFFIHSTLKVMVTLVVFFIAVVHPY